MSATSNTCDFLEYDVVSIFVLSDWIDFRSLGILDTTMTNHSTRMLWLQRLSEINNRDINVWNHSHLSLQWLIMRRLKVSLIECNDGGSIIDMAFEGFEMAGLKHFALDCCRRVTDECLSAVVRRYPKLETIVLIGRFNALDALYGNTLQVLDTSNFGGYRMKKDAGMFGQGGPLLPRIHLGRCHITDAGLLILANQFPLLQSVTLCDCNSITHEGVSALVNQCSLLRSIDLNSRQLTDACFVAIGHGCPLLKNIVLIGCRSVTDMTLSALGQGCPLLQTFHVSHCERITDAGVLALSDGCPLLRCIDLSNCRNISDAGVLSLGHRCPLLESISLPGCSSITDASVSSLGQGCPLLQEIDLCLCHNITDVGVSSLGHGCPLLHYIDLSCCRMGGTGLSLLGLGCPLLRGISIRSCFTLNEAVLALVRGCPLL